MNKTERFFSYMKNKKTAFVGTGVTNDEIIEMFLKKGISVTVCDRKTRGKMGAQADYFESLGAKLSLGDGYLDAISDFDVVFRAPGVYFNHPDLIRARENGAVITSDTEVFFDLCPCETYAITGSDGKTTTTAIISELLKAQGFNVFTGGNIGRSLLPMISDISPDDRVVAELSSFQLMSMRNSPDVAVITNISPNHLDVHKTMDEYIGCKKNILLHQNAFSKAVLNLDDPLTEELSGLVRGNLLKFSGSRVPERGAFIDGEWICFKNGGTAEKILNVNDIKIRGFHNALNFLAAVSAVFGEVSKEIIIETAKTFGGVEHRIEFIRELDGAMYYNDSIATSPTRTIAALESFDKKLILIAGGYDKNIPYEPLGGPVNRNVKTLITLGATAEKIEKAVSDYSESDPGLKILRVSSLEEAVIKAKENALKGDIIILSPASASFDLYKNFEERGAHFKRIVNGLQTKH